MNHVINKKNITNLVISLVLILIAFTWMIPFIWTLLTSLKDDSEIYTNVLRVFPSKLYFGHMYPFLPSLEISSNISGTLW